MFIDDGLKIEVDFDNDTFSYITTKLIDHVRDKFKKLFPDYTDKDLTEKIMKKFILEDVKKNNMVYQVDDNPDMASTTKLNDIMIGRDGEILRLVRTTENTFAKGIKEGLDSKGVWEKKVVNKIFSLFEGPEKSKKNRTKRNRARRNEEIEINAGASDSDESNELSTSVESNNSFYSTEQQEERQQELDKNAICVNTSNVQRSSAPHINQIRP
eukprot:UN27760